MLFELHWKSSPLAATSPNEIDNTLNPLWLRQGIQGDFYALRGKVAIEKLPYCG